MSATRGAGPQVKRKEEEGSDTLLRPDLQLEFHNQFRKFAGTGGSRHSGASIYGIRVNYSTLSIMSSGISP